ncbi:MAG: Swt1 family HEPN domain-containing protein [Spirosomataceae bacterium]
MQNNITQAQRENLTKALRIFIEEARKYIVILLSRQFGDEQWPQKYKAALSPDQQVNWSKEQAKGREPHDLIDYPHLSFVSIHFKELWRVDFQKEVTQLPTRFSQMYAVRNRISHFEETIESDEYHSFWINARAIAKGIKNQVLLEALNELEKSVALSKETVPISASPVLGEESEPESSTAHERIEEFANDTYFLPMLIRGQKFHTVHLGAEGKANPAFIRSFIFEQNADQILLFSLIEGAYQGRTTADRNQTCQISAVEVQDKALVITLQTVEQLSNPLAETPLHCTVRYDAVRKMQTLLVSINLTFECLIFRLQRQDKFYEGMIKTAFAPSQKIFDIALDFGSEASQAVEQNRNTRGLNRKKLLNLINEYYFPTLEGPFHQKDADNELFRSQVFVLKNGAVLQLESPPNQHEGQDAIRTLTAINDTDQLKTTHTLIPNPKLAHLGAYNFRVSYKDSSSNPYDAEESEFSRIVPDIQQLAIHHILHTLLKNIHKQKGIKNKLYVNIKFLVPNILEQALLTRLINQTYRFLAHPSVVKAYNIGGVEVNTLSESDAAFLGHWNTPGIPKKGANYLIVDAGKGTIDFSIIKSGDDYGLSSEYRSGFIGAGNVITYAFIETILTAMVGGEDSTWAERKRLLKIIASSQTDISTKYEFLELVEQIKRNFQPFSKTHKPLSELLPTTDVEDLRKGLATQKANSTLLSEVNRVLKNSLQLKDPNRTDEQNSPTPKPDSIRDDFGFINNAIQKLVRRLKKQVVVSDIDAVGKQLEKLNKVVLTGRGFLFGMLVEEIRKEMGKDANGEDRIIVHNTSPELRNELKKICLSGAFSERTINYDANLVGIPHLHTLTQVMTPQGAASYTKINKGPGTTSARVKSDWFGEKVFSTIFKDDDYYDDEPKPSQKSILEPIATTSSLLDFLTKGVLFDEGYNPNIHSVHISGVKYLCSGLHSGERIDLMFDGEQFWLRTENGLRAITYPREFVRNHAMVWQTLFPFFDAAAEYHTPIDGTLSDAADEL